MAILDKRRSDQRVPINSEPFFFTSAILTKDDVHTDIVLASFPAGNFQLLAPPVVEVIEGFDGTPTIDFGHGSIATDIITTGGTLTVTDQDEYVKAADITLGTAGLYIAASSDVVGMLAAGTGASLLIKGAASTVPVITAVLAATTPTVGKVRIHMLLQRLPTA
jgi:hypothetical protein